MSGKATPGPRPPNPTETKTLLLRRAAGATVDMLVVSLPKVDAQAIKALVDDAAKVRDAYAAANADSRRKAVKWVEAHGGDPAGPSPEAEQAAKPKMVTVELPKDRGQDQAATVTMSELDHSEIRRLRAEGLTWVELKAKFTLPGQVLQAVAGDVDPHQGEKDRQLAAEQQAAKAHQPKRTGNGAAKTGGRKRITHEENVAIAQRVEDGEDPAAVGVAVGLAASTVKQTWRWAKANNLLKATEAKAS
jgi:hypothetical protein